MEEQGATGFIGPKGSRGTTGFMVIYIYIYIYYYIFFYVQRQCFANYKVQ